MLIHRYIFQLLNCDDREQTVSGSHLISSANHSDVGEFQFTFCRGVQGNSLITSEMFALIWWLEGRKFELSNGMGDEIEN